VNPRDLDRRALLRGLSAFLATFVVGSLVVFVFGKATSGPASAGGSSPGPGANRSERPPATTPEAWLTWVPGGLPEGFGEGLTTLRVVDEASVATAGVAWLTRSEDAAGNVVDKPASPYMVPIDTTGIDVTTFPSFLPQGQGRKLVTDIAPGEGILSSSAAAIRGLAEGATLTFEGGAKVVVSGILPDRQMGGYELLVTNGTGQQLGIATERYAIFRIADVAEPPIKELTEELLDLVPNHAPIRAIELRAPGETTYLRANDRSATPATLKRKFGEFTAFVDDAEKNDLDLDPDWVAHNIRTRVLPVFGTVQCHTKILFLLKQAATGIENQGAADAVDDVGDCFVDTWLPDSPEGALSPHLWGAAIEINGFANEAGQEPSLDDRIVESMQGAGFAWGGNAAWPHGAYFEFVGSGA
jgi:hypothetical protein